MLTKESILAAEDITIETIEIPEWGGEVGIKMMNGEERDEFEKDAFLNKQGDVEKNFKNLRSKLLVRTLCDEKGVLLFNQKDIDALAKKSAAALDRAFSKAQTLNRLSKEDVEELTKN